MYTSGAERSVGNRWGQEEGTVTGLNDKAFTSACFDTSGWNAAEDDYLHAFRLDYSGGSVTVGPDTPSNSCTSVELPGLNIIGIKLDIGYGFIRLLFPCTVTEDTSGVTAYSSPIDLLTTGSYVFATLPLVTTDCYTSSWKLFRSVDD